MHFDSVYFHTWKNSLLASMGEEDLSNKTRAAKMTQTVDAPGSERVVAQKVPIDKEVIVQKPRGLWRQPEKGIDWAAWCLLLVFAVISIAAYPGDLDGTTVTAQKVFFYGWLTAVSTGLGAIPFCFFRELNDNYLGISNGTNIDTTRNTSI